MLAIEREVCPHPWTETQFLQELRADYSQIDLMLLQQEIAGYLCTWLVAGEMHVLNLVTAPAFRRRGVARRLLEHAFARAKAAASELACLEVRSSNHGAIALYRGFGFSEDSIRRRYYSDGEDALLMSCRLINHLDGGGRDLV